MKRKIILFIVLFISTFFVGNNKIYAATKCKTDDCKAEIAQFKKENEIGSKRLICSYAVENKKNPENKYANVIYYDFNEKKYYAQTTIKAMYGELTLYSPRFIAKDAKDVLENNFRCPRYSYIDLDGKNEICFDSDGTACNKIAEEEKSGDALRKISFGTSANSKLIDDLASNYKDYNNTYAGGCDKNNTLYNKYGNVCRYSSLEGDYILVYYGNNSNEISYYNAASNNTLQILQGKAAGDKAKGWTYSIYNDINNINSCPNNLYVAIESRTIEGFSYKNYHISNSRSDVEKYATTQMKSDFIYVPCNGDSTTPSTPDERKGCDLIDDTIRGYINAVMSYIRIGVPILLIGLIIFDFASAIFASSDDKIKKAQGRVFKRIIIAIVIFFVPTLINLVFNIVNDVWANANYEICGLDEFDN